MPARLLLNLLGLSWREWRHHPWRHGVAVLAVALGVALAWSVHLINASALAEFSSAVRAVGGEPDLVLRAQRDGFDDASFERVALHASVQLASPVLELETYGRGHGDGAEPVKTDATKTSPETLIKRIAVRVYGVDALRVASLSPQLLPQPAPGEHRLAPFDPQAVFLNAAAGKQLGATPGQTIQLQMGLGWQSLRVAGSVAAPGGPLVVMDLAGAQTTFDMTGRISRIDVRFKPAIAANERSAAVVSWALPPSVQTVAADDAALRVSNLSRAYRVNLTVLALVALFVGAFLVFSVVSLSVAQRTPALALLGVLGLTRGERRQWVLVECAALGTVGSGLGLAVGTGLAALALRWLAGDLGGGYFPGIAPSLQFDMTWLMVFGGLGVAAAVMGGWLPARQAERLAPALALKGLGQRGAQRAPPAWPAGVLITLGVGLAFVPPVAGLPLAAYAAVAALLFGGVALIPAGVHGLLLMSPAPRSASALLTLRRAYFQRHTALATVAGVVASLALSVALTVMVASFRTGVADWLTSMLPADLYARSAASAAASEQAWLSESFVRAAANVPGVQKVQASRSRSLQLVPSLPAVVLLSRDLTHDMSGREADPQTLLPLVGAALPAQAGELGIFITEAVQDLYQVGPGDWLELPLGEQLVRARVRGVWRDFARQFGAIAIDSLDYQKLTGDKKLSDMALWLQPGADIAAIQRSLRALLPDPSMIEFAATRELRALSLRIFDRSFAVTYYLQAVAIVIGLVGVAASLSAQVLARRKEFGLLAHLGFTRSQVLTIVAGESGVWLAAGVLLGCAMGLAVSVVLVMVVNPQSFHWRMPLVLPWWDLLALCAAVLVAGVATATLSARHATGRAAVLSVKEDW